MLSPILGRRLTAGLAAAGVLLLLAPIALAAPPAGYYDSVDTNNSTTLRDTLHAVIDDHTRFPYTASSTDTWNILNLADEDPNNSNNILDLYKNASYTKISGGVGAYNREHVWPKSYGFPDDGTDNSAYTDCHHLFAADASYNSSRSNKPFRNCNSGCSEQTTDFNDGSGGGSGVYPGNSNWTTGSFTQGTWETWGDRKGDVARAIFYMDVRYEGGIHGGTGFAEPDLRVTDNEALIDASNTGNNEAVAYMGMLSVLLQWHEDDPPDSGEMARNDVVYSFQGNRNPFVDNPQWVGCVFQNVCNFDNTAPSAPFSLIASGLDGAVDLSWVANGEGDLAGYNVYRSTTSGGNYSKVNAGLVTTSSYVDSGRNNGVTYYYVVTAVDTSNNESTDSNQASATPSGGGGGSCSNCIDWGATATVSYSNQDSAGNVSVQNGGDAILLQDNTWRRTTQTFTVTANTVVEFDFDSTAQGEIHGIGFDEDDTLSSNRIFKVHGTQNWGITDFDNYTSGTTTYTIPVGQFFTGSNMYLVLANDYDAGSGNNSTFSNVRVYETGGGGGGGGGGGNELQNGVPVTGLSGAANSEQFFTVQVPAGASNLNIDISGGSGDADLYVRFGAAPTTSTYDCRPYESGNTENCSFSTPSAGTYHVMVRAYSAYSSLTLEASYSTGGGGGGGDQGQTWSNLSGATGNQQTFTQTITTSSQLTVTMSGGSGDADLYVRFGAAPTTSTYDCRPYLNGNNETCTINPASSGTYHIMVRGYSTFSGVTVTTTPQ